MRSVSRNFGPAAEFCFRQQPTTVDGVFGRGTRRSVRRYERAEELRDPLRWSRYAGAPTRPIRWR